MNHGGFFVQPRLAYGLHLFALGRAALVGHAHCIATLFQGISGACVARAHFLEAVGIERDLMPNALVARQIDAGDRLQGCSA